MIPAPTTAIIPRPAVCMGAAPVDEVAAATSLVIKLVIVLLPEVITDVMTVSELEAGGLRAGFISVDAKTEVMAELPDPIVVVSMAITDDGMVVVYSMVMVELPEVMTVIPEVTIPPPTGTEVTVVMVEPLMVMVIGEVV